jgi:protein tyrosine phosphatase
MDRALEQAKEGVVDVMGIVNGMRQQRMKMIQTLVSMIMREAPLYPISCI